MGLEAERAETYLRLLAEAAIRHSSTEPHGPGPDRMRRAADTLTDAGVITDEQATDILLMLQTALRVRGRQEFLAVGRIRAIRQLGGITRPSRGPGPGTPVAVAQQPAPSPPEDPHARSASPEPPWRVIQAAPGPAAESRLMALIVTGDRMIAPATLGFPPSAGLDDNAVPSFADLIARDDAGTRYEVSFTDGAWAGSSWTGTIVLRPPAPLSARVLTIGTQREPLLRLQLAPAPAAGPVPAVTLEPVAHSPGERLLIRRAESLLGTLSGTDSPAGARWQPFGSSGSSGSSETRRVAVSGILDALLTSPPPTMPAAANRPVAYHSGHASEPDLPELVETLEGAGILSPLSAVPAQVAALAQTLGLPVPGPGEGIPPSWLADTRLPARWASVLAYYGRRHHPPLMTGTGAVGAVLPEVDGARFVVAGARASQRGTVLHVIGRGLRPILRPIQDLRFSWWVRQDSGTWHLGVVRSWHSADDDLRIRLAVLPPLTPGSPGTTSTLTLELTGTHHQVTTDLRVRW